MMRVLPNCPKPKCGENDLWICAGTDGIRLCCAECGWCSDLITNAMLRDAPDKDALIAATVKAAKEAGVSIGEAAAKAASGLAASMLKRRLDEGGTINIPSLGITIGPEPDDATPIANLPEP